MPHYKNTQNKLYWLDSEEYESYLPSGCIKITDEEADTIRAAEEAARVASLSYAQKRAGEYPPIPDQLDYIYHHGIEAWKQDVVNPIKDKYPKG